MISLVDWKAKLTSRKFWMAIVGFVSGILLAFKVDAQTVETISGVVMAGAAVIAYIIGEGMADAASAANEPPLIVGHADWNLDDFTKEKEVTDDVGEVSK